MLRAKLRKVHTMDLKTYINSLPRGGAAALAGKLSITPVYLSQLTTRQDGRKPSPELCVSIETETQGSVRRQDLRPDDWSRIWPELIGQQQEQAQAEGQG
jgi:DNA-binding transcriptional regulator YdaS (Cro superfamily)